ncbi:hypothetical protein OAI46_06970, partial [Alphaproteobacteria bacterium]|nr:hypothetical protein [Alphaproteobacteria bacterium]
IADKVEVLEQLGVPGIWANWGKGVRGVPPMRLGSDRSHFKYSKGGVFRLSSGVSSGALDDSSARVVRYTARMDAILRSVFHLIESFGTENKEYLDLILGSEMNGFRSKTPSPKAKAAQDKE